MNPYVPIPCIKLHILSLNAGPQHTLVLETHGWMTERHLLLINVTKSKAKLQRNVELRNANSGAIYYEVTP